MQFVVCPPPPPPPPIKNPGFAYGRSKLLPATGLEVFKFFDVGNLQKGWERGVSEAVASLFSQINFSFTQLC